MTPFETAMMQALAEISESLKSHNEGLTSCQEILISHRDAINALCKNAETDNKFFKEIVKRFINDEKVVENLVNALVAGNILTKEKPKEEAIN